ncbi:MAG: type II toxin-antitoxin system Phd/YefM family antitoxin [Candidatus Latescibacteria bacterium]|nr:type II toxin-antitoxin system Phd/YefM family antitoxin [Candidatus Latescibacterota bacterium]
MTKVISIEDVREHLEALIAEVQAHGTSVIIQNEDQPVAVLLSEEEYISLKRLEKETALQDLGALLDQIHARNTHFSEEEAARDVVRAHHERQ